MKINHNIKSDDGENNNFLSSIKKLNPFYVPENYFDDLPHEIIGKIIIQEKKKELHIIQEPLYGRINISFTLRIAAVIFSLSVLSLIIVALVLFFNKNVPLSNENILSETEIRQIIKNHDLYNIDESIIIEQYISSNIADEYVYGTDLSKEEINNYLEENTDINNIINQF